MIFGRVYKRQNQKSDSIGDNFRFTTFQIYGINPKRKLQITRAFAIDVSLTPTACPLSILKVSMALYIFIPVNRPMM